MAVILHTIGTIDVDYIIRRWPDEIASRSHRTFNK